MRFFLFSKNSVPLQPFKKFQSMKVIKYLCFLLLNVQSITLSAQNMGAKLPAGTLPNTTLDVNGAASLREGTALTLVNGANNDINLATEYSFYRITGPTAAFSITGFNNGQDGRILTVVNATTQTMTISGATGSIAANQLLTGGLTFSVTANGSATFQYNTTLAKWVLTGTSGSSTASNDWSLTGNSGTTAGTNFIGTTDAVDFVTKTSNTEWMRITSAGNIGLGLTTPSVKMHIDGSTATATYQKFTANTTTGQTATDGFDVGIDATGNAVLKQNEALPILLSTSATEQMRITSAGNVGIGTTTPTGKLEVTGTSGLDFMHTRYTTSGGVGANLNLRRSYSATIGTNVAVPDGEVIGRINFSSNTGDNTTPYNANTNADIRVLQKGAASLTNNGSEMAFAVTVQNTIQQAERMRLSNVGYLGIGTGTPQYKLDVNAYSGSAGDPLRLLGLNAGATTDSVLTSASGVVRRLSVAQVLGNAWNIAGNSGTTAGTNFIGTTDAQGLAFRTNNTEWMRMSTTGSIGLGLTSPSVKMHLDGGTATATYQKFTANTTTGQTATDGFDVGIDASANAVLNQREALPMIFSTNATERMRVLSGGNVGIGTTAATNTLHVFAASNPVRLEGLQTGASTDNMLTADATGVVRQVSAPTFVDIADLKGTAAITTGTLSATSASAALGTATATIYTKTFTLSRASLVFIDAIIDGDQIRSTSNAVITDGATRMFKTWWELSSATNKYGACTTAYTNAVLDNPTLWGTWCNNSSCHIVLAAGTYTLNLNVLIACPAFRNVRVTYGNNSNDRISIKAIQLQ